ncbi:hypothetical protein EC957_001719 [Mortierella hygrophila]|uniref:Arrestin C-terminal-like domain-containing protein n=1 Tax=Mortierella hygrophila TaxID=979708 RepID=A0A9P6F5Y1_9FUNG|nr:hypothetical protein EC957_001719 [Mortierella hygrophila]
MRFFSKISPANIAATYLAPNGLSISLATKNGHPRRYGPGTILHGQVNLSLSKPILRPCQLRVVFTCTTTLDFTTDAGDHNDKLVAATSSSTTPLTTLFEVEHILIDDQTLTACGRHAPLHFCIKLPLCNYPPSLEEGERFVHYTLQAILSFDADLGNGTIVKTFTSSTPSKIVYMPHVSYAAAMFGEAQQTRLGVTNAAAVATASCRPTSSNVPIHETSGQLVVESQSGSKTINASVQSKTSVCIGDHASMVLKVENESNITLQAIRLALVRQISFPSSSSPNYSPKVAGNLPSHSVHTSFSSSPSYINPILTTVHAATIPVAKVSNRNSTWTQQLQFRIPSHLNLLPSINKSITPLFHVEYFIVLSLPIPQRQGGFVSRLAASTRKRPSIDLSIFHSHSSSPSSSSSSAGVTDTCHLLSTSPPGSSDVSSSSKMPTALQLAPIPITLTSVPSYTDGRNSRPIPHHMEVEDRPTFVRDRFEEEMIQQLSSLESLLMDDGDDDDLDIDLLVEEACRRRRRRNASSSEDSDVDENDDEEVGQEEEEEDEDDSRVPARFRHPYRNSSLPTPASNSGLGTPPPSPPYLAKAMSDDSMIQTMRERSFARHMAQPPSILTVATLGGQLCG